MRDLDHILRAVDERMALNALSRERECVEHAPSVSDVQAAIDHADSYGVLDLR